MRDIDKSIELYTLMAERQEKSGLSPHQLKVNLESIELLKTCETREEAEEKFKQSPLYTAAGQAVMLDKLAALERAMRDLEMNDMAEVYHAKYLEVKEDYLKAWDTGYTNKISELKLKYENKISDFKTVFGAVVNYLGANTDKISKESVKKDLENITNSIANLAKQGVDFEELTKEPVFRNMIPFDDENYQRIVNMAIEYNTRGTITLSAADEDASDIIAFAKKNENEMIEAAKESPMIKSICTAIPCEDAPYKYKFEM